MAIEPTPMMEEDASNLGLNSLDSALYSDDANTTVALSNLKAEDAKTLAEQWEGASTNFLEYSTGRSGEKYDPAKEEEFKNFVPAWMFERTMSDLQDQTFPDPNAFAAPILNKNVGDNPAPFANWDRHQNSERNAVYTERESSHHVDLFTGQIRENYPELDDDEYEMLAVATHLSEAGEIEFDDVVAGLDSYASAYAHAEGLTDDSIKSVFGHMKSGVVDREAKRELDTDHWVEARKMAIQGINVEKSLGLKTILKDEGSMRKARVQRLARDHTFATYGENINRAREVIQQLAAGIDEEGAVGETKNRSRMSWGLLDLSEKDMRQTVELVLEIAALESEKVDGSMSKMATNFQKAVGGSGEDIMTSSVKRGTTLKRRWNLLVPEKYEWDKTDAEVKAEKHRELMQTLRQARNTYRDSEAEGFWESVGSGITSNVHYFGMFAMPFGIGKSAMAMDMAAKADEQLRLEYPDMNPDLRWELSGTVGVLQMFTENIQMGWVTKGFPSVTRLIGGTGAKRTAGVLAARLLAANASEYGEEVVQSATKTLMHKVWHEIGVDIPDVNQKDWDDNFWYWEDGDMIPFWDADIFTSLVGLSALGAGGRAVYEKFGAKEVKRQLADVDRLMLVGLPRSEAEAIAETNKVDQTKAFQQYQDAVNSKDKGERRGYIKEARKDGAATRVIEKDVALAEKAVKEGGTQSERDTLKYNAARLEYTNKFSAHMEEVEGGGFELIYPEADIRPTETYETRALAEEALLQHQQEVDESFTRETAEQVQAVEGVELAAEFIRGQHAKAGVKAEILTNEDIRQIKEFADESAANMQLALDRVQHSLLEQGFSRPAEVGDFDNFVIQAEVKLREDARGYLERVAKGAKPNAVLEDAAEGFLGVQIAQGVVTKGWVKQQLFDYQKHTGDVRVEVKSPEEISDLRMKEVFSDLALGNAFNAAADGKFGKLSAFIRAFRHYVRGIMTAALNLQKLSKDGVIAPDFQILLDQSVGLNMDEQIKRQTVEAQEGILDELSQSITPQDASFSIAPAFYSKMEDVLDKKIQGKQATPEQIKSIIDPSKGSGVKAEEIKWTGVMQKIDQLAADNNGKVPKAELMDWLKNDAAVEFEEVVMGDGGNKQWTQEDIDSLEQEARRTRNFDAYEQAVLEYEDQQLGTNANDTGNETQYAEYQVPNGENYKETVLTMPVKGASDKSKVGEYYDNFIREGGEPSFSELSIYEQQEVVDTAPSQVFNRVESNYTSSHFGDIPNYVAHMRTNERQDSTGDEGLFIEEIQSDLHQEGRKRGYKGESTEKNNWSAKLDENDIWDVTDGSDWEMSVIAKSEKEAVDKAWKQTHEQEIPDAPFRKDWHLQMFKRGLRDAIAAGKDWIGWTVGQTQNERYDLSNQVKEVVVPMINKDGSRSVRVEVKENRSAIRMMVDKNAIVTGQYSNATQFNGKKLDEVLGKDVAEKIMNLTKPTTLTGNDLAVGGSGMKGFYDNMLPTAVQKYVKQWGAKVEDGKLTTRGFDPAEETEFVIRDQNGNEAAGITTMTNAPSRIAQLDMDRPEDAPHSVEPRLNEKTVPFHKVEITDAMRESIEEIGQTSFSITPAQDAAYMGAVESGDIETQRRMVDEAAKRAGYDSPKVYHGSNEKYDVFSKTFSERPSSYVLRDLGLEAEYRGSYYFTESEVTAEYYGDVKSFYLKMENPARDEGRVDKDGFKAGNFRAMQERVLADGYDGIITREMVDVPSDEADFLAEIMPIDAAVRDEVSAKLFAPLHIAFNPNQIKSADPVTKDADGNVIPLSQRFDPSRDEISMSLSPASDAVLMKINELARDPDTRLEIYRQMAVKVKQAQSAMVGEDDTTDAIVSNMKTIEAIISVLPMEIRYKAGRAAAMTKFSTVEQGMKYLVKRLDYVDTLLEEYLRKDLDSRVRRGIRASQPAAKYKASATGRSKIGDEARTVVGADGEIDFKYIGHRIGIAAAKAIIKNPQQAQAAAAEERAKIDENTTVAKQQEYEDVAYTYELFADIKNADSNRLTMMLDLLKTNWDEGRKGWRRELGMRKDWKVTRKSAIIKGLLGKDYYESHAERARGKDLKSSWVANTARETTSIYHMLDFLREDMMGTPAAKFFKDMADDLRRASNKFDMEQINHRKMMKKAFSDIFQFKGTNKTARVQARIHDMSKGVEWGNKVTHSIMYDHEIKANKKQMEAAYDELAANEEQETVFLRDQEVTRAEFDEVYSEYLANFDIDVLEGFDKPSERKVFTHSVRRNTGKRETVGLMSQLDLLKDWLSVQQSDIKMRYEQSGYDDKYRSQLDDVLDEDTKRMGLWMQDILRQGTPATEALHRSEYGLAMATVMNYFPAVFQHKFSDTDSRLQIEGVDVAGVSKRPSSHMMRVNHKSAPERQNAVNTFNHHLMQNAYWMTHAEVLRKWGGILRDTQVQDVILRTKGRGFLSNLNSTFDNLEDQGAKVAQAQIESDVLWRNIGKGLSLGVLGLKISSTFKNALAGANVLYTRDWTDLAKTLTSGELIEAGKELYASDTFQRRLEMGASVATRYALQGSASSNIVFATSTRMAELGIQPINVFDTGTNLTMAMAYVAEKQSLRKTNPNMSEADIKVQALDYIDDMMARYAQPADRMSKSLMENTRPVLGKFLVLFQSEARKYLVINALAGRKLLTGKGVQSRKLAAQQMLVSNLVVTGGLHLIEAAFSSLFRNYGEGDDPEEKFLNEFFDGKKFLAALIADQLAGVPLFGGAWTMGVNKLMGEKVFTSTSNPMVRSIGGAATLLTSAAKMDKNSASENADIILKSFQSFFAMMPQTAVIAQTSNVARDALGLLNNTFFQGLTEADTFDLYSKRLRKSASDVTARFKEEKDDAKESGDKMLLRQIDAEIKQEKIDRAYDILFELPEPKRVEYLQRQAEMEKPHIPKYMIRAFSSL